ncbi:hypothetical protein [Kitasatospora sp. NPDC088346]|uniref:hypothetical protein n=1 Tax=Kitasatospora sp. NPDC088346 TaxID=3364073 RepID=UPI003816AA4F
MTSMEELAQALVPESAWDVQVPGFIDRDGRHPQFVPLSAAVYVALSEGFLRLDSVAGRSQLAVRRVDDVEVPEALLDEDEEFSLASFGEPFLADAHRGFRITRIRWVTDPGSDAAAGVVRCAEFEFEDAWPVFADPGWHFGIRLEGVGAFDRWLAREREAGVDLDVASWTR